MMNIKVEIKCQNCRYKSNMIISYAGGDFIDTGTSSESADRLFISSVVMPKPDSTAFVLVGVKSFSFSSKNN